MNKLSLLAIGAAALTVAGIGPAAAHDRDQFSFGIFLGGPVVEEPDYDAEAAYWARRRWAEHERWEAYQRALAEERCAHERERAERTYYAPARWGWGWHHPWHDDD